MPQSYPVNNHKFYKLYLALNSTEQEEFRNFCSLKISGKGRNYRNIFNNIIVDKKNNPPSRTRWNRLSELTRLMEDYLLLKYMRENKEERNIALLDVYNNRNIESIIEQQFNFAVKQVEKEKFGYDTLYNLHRLHFDISTYHIQQNRYIKFVKHFRKHSEYILSYFLNTMFMLQTEFNQQKLENIWHDWLANETILSALDSESVIGQFRENLPEVYNQLNYAYYLFKAYDNPDNTEYFFKARQEFNVIYTNLNRNFIAMAYQAFINYCINRTNNYDTSFNRVLFDIYNEKLERGIDDDIRKRNYPTNNFRDYVIIGLRLKEFNWVDNFINTYGKILPEDYKPDEENITLAMLYMAKKEYDKALKTLENTKRKNYLHYVDISDIKLRIYYIKDDMIKAYEELARLEKYISSNELIPRERRVSYELFCKGYKRLLRLREKFSIDRLAKTELFLKKHPNFFRKNWIEEKINELGS